MNNEENQEYDVVIDTLVKYRNKLWEMTKRNMESEYVGMNIMDDIRLRQIDELKEAIDVWKNHKAGQAKFEELAAIVLNEEREQCAKLCEEIEMQGHALWDRTADPDAQGRATGAMDCAAAIRARIEP